MKRYMNPIAIAVVALIAGSLALGAAADGRQLLDLSGVRGGLVVHVGCGQGELLADLATRHGFLIHGLDANSDNVKSSQRLLAERKFYGRASAETWSGGALPYTDNLVNLLIVEAPDVAETEIQRVLSPGGVALVKAGNQWKKTVKARPADIDEWTHFLHGPDNNAVAKDMVSGPPHHLQWLAEPQAARHHDHLATISAVVLAGGRMFSIEDRGAIASIALPARWSLIGRDAFNGVLLWSKSIHAWEPHLRKFRSGPTHLPRRLVAEGERVYVTLGYGAPVTAHDAATGEILRTYARTEDAAEILLADDVLYVVRRGPDDAEVLAVQAQSGVVRWTITGLDVVNLEPQTLAVERDVFGQVGEQVRCWDKTTGKERWRSAQRSGKSGGRADGSRAPTLVVHGGVVLSADGGELIALDAADGKKLWAAPTAYGYNSPIDVFVAGRLVWTGTGAGKVGEVLGRDLRSGEVKKRLDGAGVYSAPGMAHPRCYRNKATERFLVLGRAGVEFLDVDSGEISLNHWVRGVCQYGVVPCNGLLYVPPHACACYLDARLNGFHALAPERRPAMEAPGSPALEKGPAFAQASGTSPAADDWPTYRHDDARSGHTAAAVGKDLSAAWQATLTTRPSAPVMVGGKVFVAATDAHAVYALDASSGAATWQFTAGGRVDSPPTIHEGKAIFGCADGWVYAVRAKDGALVWRHRAAPEERRAVAYGQLESVWPVPGSVLIHKGEVWCAAGRSTYLDGGIHLLRLKADTGELIGRTVLNSRDKGGKQPPIGTPSLLDATLNDVLASDGESVFMRHSRFDSQAKLAGANAPHLFSPLGFLHDTWWHRGYFTFGSSFLAGFTAWSQWPSTGNTSPSGQLLVMDESTIYGYGRRVYGNLWPVDYVGKDVTQGREYQLFATKRNPAGDDGTAAPARSRPGAKGGKGANPATAATSVRYPMTWKVAVPLKVRAMVLAGDVLYVAGPPDFGPQDTDAIGTWEGKRGAVLAAFSAKDGSNLRQWDLESLPVFDSMIVAGGRLVLSTIDGRVRCFAAP